MKRLLLILVLAGIGLSFFWTFTKGESNEIYRESVQYKLNPTTASSQAKVEPDVHFGIPSKIIIPDIDVNASVEVVMMDMKGNMDVPKNPYNTAWYSLGYNPGEKGSAVIAGHYDTETGTPAVFWDLGKLNTGDAVTVIDTIGKELEFSVIRIERYPYNNFPIKEVFGSSDEPRLNLITCGGIWDKNAKTYKERTVVYTELSD